MFTKEAISAHIQNGFEAISNPEYRVELRVLPWFTVGPLRLPRCSSILSVGTANHTICTKTWSFITYRVHAIIETGCGLTTSLPTALQMLRKDLHLMHCHFVDILGHSIFGPDDAAVLIKYSSQVTSWPWNAIVCYLGRWSLYPCHLNILTIFNTVASILIF